MPGNVFTFEDMTHLLLGASRVRRDRQAFDDSGYVGCGSRTRLDFDWFMPCFVFEMVDEIRLGERVGCLIVDDGVNVDEFGATRLIVLSKDDFATRPSIAVLAKLGASANDWCGCISTFGFSRCRCYGGARIGRGSSGPLPAMVFGGVAPVVVMH